MKCIALVIGIDHYNDVDNYPELHTAVSDANAVAEVLQELKFEVDAALDEDDIVTLTYYGDFIDKLSKEKYDVAVFYFAGHGKQLNLKDCIVFKEAVDPNIGSGMPAKRSAKEVNEISQNMNAAGNQMNIIIIDACRTQRGRGASSASSIDSKINIPFQTFIAYSTSVGTTASDGKAGGHSPFATALLNHIKEEKLPVEQLFKKVRQDMNKDGLTQLSWDYSCLIDEFCFNRGQAGRFYGKPYERGVYVPSIYVASNNDAAKTIDLMAKRNAQDVKTAIDILMQKWQSFTDSDLFVIGRMILRNANRNNKECTELLFKPHVIKVFNRVGENHLLRGIYYEAYFDENGDVRRRMNVTGSSLFDLARLDLLIRNSDAKEFIRAELGGNIENFFYIVGDRHGSYVRIETRESDYYYQGGELIEIESIHVEGADCTKDVAYKKSVYNADYLRRSLVDAFQIPPQLLNWNLKKVSATTLFTPYKIRHLHESLLNCLINNNPSEVVVLSSNSYVESVLDISINRMTPTEGGLSVEGVCDVEIHMEFDKEEMEPMMMPCSFTVEMEENSDGMFVMVGNSGLFKVDTSAYYQ